MNADYFSNKFLLQIRKNKKEKRLLNFVTGHTLAT